MTLRLDNVLLPKVSNYNALISFTDYQQQILCPVRHVLPNLEVSDGAGPRGASSVLSLGNRVHSGGMIHVHNPMHVHVMCPTHVRDFLGWLVEFITKFF